MEDAFSGLGNGTKFDNKVLQTSHSTVGHLSTKLRLVRCPKCRQLLQESANVPVYKCGGCYTVLRAKKHKNDQDKCFLKHNNGGDPNEYAQSNGKYIGGANLLDEVASPTEPNHHKSAESEVDKSGNCLEEELRLVTVKMPHWQPKDPEQRYAISRRPLVESMNQHSVSQLPNKAPESFAEWNAKKCEGRNKGRKKSRKAKVETGFPSPPSSKSIVLHRRPGYGQMVSKCLVKANHFLAEISKRDLTQCSVTIEPEVGSTKLNIAIMTQLVKLHRDTDLGKRLPVYDGRKAFYTAGVLPFTSKEFTIQLAEEDEGLGIIREREFKVTIKFAARAGMHQLHELISGKQIDTSLEARKIIAIVLKQLACQRYVSVGRFFYCSNIKRPQLLGNGLQSWRGFYQSLKPTQMGLSLNIDMSATAFIEPLPVIEFVAQVLGKDVYSRPLSDADCVKVKKALRGVKFEVTHRGNMRRKYRISGLTSLPTSELIFPVDEEKNMKSVIDYFQEVYGFTIRHSHLPCLLVGSARKVNYLPMEACKIVEGQRYSKRLNDKQITSLLKLSCQRPKEQEAEILQSAIGLLYGGHILCLSETKIVRKTLKGKCRSMSVLSLEDHIQHVDRRWEDAAKSHGAKRICRQLVIHRLSTAKHIRKQHGIHRWPFQRFAIGLPDGGHILPLLEKKIVRKTLKRKCRSMRVLSLVGCQQHVDRRWEDAAKYIGAKHICRQLKIPRVSIAKRICRQHGIHHRWPFERDRGTMKGYTLGVRLSMDGKLVSRLQVIYISWLGRFSPLPSTLPGGEIVGHIALSSSQFATTNSIAQRVGQDQSGSASSDSENERTREQENPEEIYTSSITKDDLLRRMGRMNCKDAAASLGISLSTFKRKRSEFGIKQWPHVRGKKVGRPPDQHGERNASTACETPLHNVHARMEGEPVGQNQEANEFRRDLMEHSIALNTENDSTIAVYNETDAARGSSKWAFQLEGQTMQSTAHPYRNDLVFSQPQIASIEVPNENMGSLQDRRDLLASQVVAPQQEPLLEGHVSGFVNWTVGSCSDLAPTQPMHTFSHATGSSENLENWLASMEEHLMEENVYGSSRSDPSLSQPMRTIHHTMATIPHMMPLPTERQDMRSVKLKATYGDTKIKFQFPLTSGINELKEVMSKILERELGSFKVEYKDEDGEWILMALDEHVREYLQLLTSLGNKVTELKVQDKVPNTTNFCANCRCYNRRSLKRKRP